METFCSGGSRNLEITETHKMDAEPFTVIPQIVEALRKKLPGIQ